MRTIRFDEEDHLHPAPYFNLPALQNGQISLRDFYEASDLVLMFVPDACLDCIQFLQQLAARSQDFAQENARLLAIFTAGSQPVPKLLNPLNGKVLLLEDPGQAVRRAYAGLMAPGLVGDADLLCFVLDQYGAPYACLAGSRPGSADLEAILSWLRFIGIQCPE